MYIMYMVSKIFSIACRQIVLTWNESISENLNFQHTTDIVMAWSMYMSTEIYFIMTQNWIKQIKKHSEILAEGLLDIFFI